VGGVAVEEVLRELDGILKELSKHEETCGRAAMWIHEALRYLSRDTERFALVMRDDRVCVAGSLWRACYDNASNMAVKQVYERFFSDAEHLTGLLKLVASGLKECADAVLARIEELDRQVKRLESRLRGT